MHVWDGECHVHAGIRPRDIAEMRAAHPGADFLIHPECGCSTSVMEYVAAGDVDPEGVHMLSTGGMLDYAAHATARHRRRSSPPRPACCTRCSMAAPDVDFIAANERGGLPLHEDDHAAEAARRAARPASREVKVPEAIAERARLPIERMVAIRRSAARGRRVAATARSSRPCSAASRTAFSESRLRSNSAGRVAVDLGRGAHLVGVPERARRVDALEPRHAVEVLARRVRRRTRARARAANRHRARPPPAPRRAGRAAPATGP